MKRKPVIPTVVLIALACLTLGGCQHAMVGTTVVSQVPGSDPADQLEFWHQLAEKPLASNDDAFHALLMFFDQSDVATNYEQRMNLLKTRGMLPDDFHRPASEAAMRGTVAMVLAKALHIKGGLVMRLTGLTPRYATRELIYEGIYPLCSPQQTFTGGEFVAIVGRVEDYRQYRHLAAAPEEPAMETVEPEALPEG